MLELFLSSIPAVPNQRPWHTFGSEPAPLAHLQLRTSALGTPFGAPPVPNQCLGAPFLHSRFEIGPLVALSVPNQHQKRIGHSTSLTSCLYCGSRWCCLHPGQKQQIPRAQKRSSRGDRSHIIASADLVVLSDLMHGVVWIVA